MAQKSKFGRFIQRCGKAIHSFFSSPIMVGLPFAILTFIVSVDFSSFLTGLANRTSAEYLVSVKSASLIADGEELKGSILPLVYAFTMLVALANFNILWTFVKNNTHLVFILLVISAGVAYSLEPVKVLTNTITIYVGIVAAILVASSYLKNKNFNTLFFSMLLPMAAIHIMSEYSLFATDVNPLDILNSPNRFRGITFNPNGLALSSVLGIWAACSVLVAEKVWVIFKLLAAALIGLFVFNILLAESATALTIAGAGFLLGIYLKFLQFFKTGYRTVLTLFFVLSSVGVAIYVTLASSSEQLFSSFAGSLGKDSSLTGRTDLWGMALDAIKEKPLIGYGFDSHISIKSNALYDMQYNHYHNGYLDTLIASGPLLLILLFFNYSKHSKNVFALMQTNGTAFTLSIPLLMVLLHNFSEYSMMRPNSAIWLLYVAAFAAAFFASHHSGIKTGSNFRIFRSKKRSPQRSKEKRYRFG